MDQLINQMLSKINSGSLTQISAKAPLFVELLATKIAKTRPVILIPKMGEFQTRLKNVRFFLENSTLTLQLLPGDERSVFHATSADPLIRMEQVATRFNLAVAEPADVRIFSLDTLLQRIPSAKDLQKHAQMLVKGENLDRDALIRSLILLGYSKVPHVLDRGTFAIRGSVIDIFVNGQKKPIRLDLFGDEIESIKHFDETTQRSYQSLELALIGPVKEIALDDEAIALAEEKLLQLADSVNYPTLKLNEKLRDIGNGLHFYGMEKLLPAFYPRLSSTLELLLQSYKDPPLLIFEDKTALFLEIKSFEEKMEELSHQATLRGDLIFSKEDYFLSSAELENLLANFKTLDISALPKEGSETFVCEETTTIRQDIIKASATTSKDEVPHLLKPLADTLKTFHKDKITTLITVSSREHQGELKRLLEPFHLNISHLTSKDSLEDPAELFKPHIHAFTLITKHPPAFGALFTSLGWALIAEDDIFGKRTKRKERGGKQQGFSTSIADLELDDLVVHVDHGVGRFKGLVRLTVRGVDNDYVLLHYANDEKLYLPTYRINLIKPHGSNKESGVRLDKLGGTAWVSKKTKVKEAVMTMAQDLLKLYAKRELVERPPFIEPDAHYVEFESSFEFETTTDQQKAIDDVIADLQRKRPMDRLVCGDVGYGKTEVAMRAAMLSVLSKRQVALLSPTTVLAQQHGITFAERFKNTGVSIAVLSRFQKAQEVKAILNDLRQNKVDIVIGTHRLLSSDVAFHDLGLIIIDEEQRFGIKAKEHLKKMRTKVDVLTMSATPIPRTMQMSYFGLRDLSIIETPPIDRRAIETQVVQFDDAVIKEAIMRELSRGGQVYFVHNRVQSIEATADYLRSLVPEARIAVGHGQMNEVDLEKVMLGFMNHEINILVCTTIIETGIDVPTANTMFINDADDFGLSQLYQLRGRIGRSKERAFAYLLIKQQTEHLTPIARTRLEILHKFSELGAGFRIAQHDLELRGAGDLLGKSQHGHMAAIGYDLYAELLKDAVKELQGQAEEETVEPEVVLPISALIPEKYCPDLHERMSFYQRLATADHKEKIESIFFGLEDLYGEAPPEVVALKIMALIKLELKKIYATRLEITKKDGGFFSITISISTKTPVNHEKLMAAMKEGSSLRVTPQHKIIQQLKANLSNEYEDILSLSTLAINNIKKELFY